MYICQMKKILTKEQFESFFKGLTFKEENHEYKFNDNKIKLSVSGVIKLFHEPFDTEGISLRVSQRRGVSQDTIKREWELAAETGCNIGNKAHAFGEIYPFDRTLKPQTKLDEAIVKFWNDLPDYIIPVVMELEMYHFRYKFAGTSDILLYNTRTKTYMIVDYKTNKDLFKNYKNQMMRGIFSHLLLTPYSKYVIQLSLYQLLLEQTGIEVSKRKILWLKRDGNYELYDTKDYTRELNQHLMNNSVA